MQSMSEQEYRTHKLRRTFLAAEKNWKQDLKLDEFEYMRKGYRDTTPSQSDSGEKTPHNNSSSLEPEQDYKFETISENTNKLYDEIPSKDINSQMLIPSSQSSSPWTEQSILH